MEGHALIVKKLAIQTMFVQCHRYVDLHVVHDIHVDKTFT